MNDFQADIYLILEKTLRILRGNIRRIVDEFDMGELTFTEMNIMNFIGESPRTMKDIIAEMSIANSTPTRIIDGLVSKGIVERSNDSEDRRRVIVQLTPSGVGMFRRIREKLSEQTEIAVRCLTDQERKMFADIIRKINSSQMNPE